MESVVPRSYPSLPNLGGTIKQSNNTNRGTDSLPHTGGTCKGELVWHGDPASVPQTPTLSDQASDRVDPIDLLSRPVEGFHHPRQHIFTDRLVGRFYEDSSLDAETRKTSKCLAGRLGTAGSTSTRPSTTGGGLLTLLQLGSSHSPPSTRRVKHMRTSASVGTLGGGQRGAMTASTSRKEQVEREIMEQKALIENLEKKMASLSSREACAVGTQGRDADEPRGSTAPPRGGSEGGRKGADDRPDTTPGPERVAEAIGVGNHSPAEPEENDVRAAECAHSFRRELQTSVDDRPLAARRARTCSWQEERSAVTIQRTVRGAGNRKNFLSLQFARDEFEGHLQRVLTSAGSLAQRAQPESETTSGIASGEPSDTGWEEVSAAASLLIETNRKNGIAKPPFEIFRALHTGVEQIVGAVACLTAVELDGREDDVGDDTRQPFLDIGESCSVAERALETIREALGANFSGPDSSLRDPPPFAAGSGRAAAVAVTSAKGGLLASPGSPCGHEQVVRSAMDGSEQEEGGKRGEDGSRLGDRSQSPSVPLSSIGVERVESLLRAHGFGEHAPAFVEQAVDGVMLSDPHLCEADFAELGLGYVEGAENCRARLVSLFRRYQEEGVTPVGDSSRVLEGVDTNGPRETPFTDASGLNNLGERSPLEDVADACSLDLVQELEAPGSSADENNPVADSPWGRRPTVQQSLEDQHVIAEISLDLDEERAVATATADGQIKRLSVKLNSRVVVTMGDHEADLIDDVDGLSDFEGEDDSESQGEDEEFQATVAMPPAQNQSRRTSLQTVTLDVERNRNVGRDPLHNEDEQLSPGLVVNAANETVNVFR